MATCRYCQRGGFFRAVDKSGLCADCQRPVMIAIKSQWRVFQSSLAIATTAKSLSTRLSRWELVLDKAEALLEFERRGIPTTDPPPSRLIESARGDMVEAITEGLQEEISEAESKSRVATTATSRLSPMGRVIAEIERIRRRYDDLPGLDEELVEIEAEARRRYREIQVDALTEAARKAEFMGQKRKAIDGYREALYSLRHDDVPDEEQAREIGELESAIDRLVGPVPGGVPGVDE
jgi:hypothetical protein